MKSNLMEVVMQFAKHDDRVSSVILRGSRTNPNGMVDDDSDYDVLLGVCDLPSFQANDDWLSIFGDCLIMQKPESMFSERNSQKDYKEAYLMQFRDGSRLDLVLLVESKVQAAIKEDSLSLILLDKMNALKADEPNESSYEMRHFVLEDCVNEFLWLSFYVVKGARRKQLMYTQNHLSMMRDEFMNLISYQYGGNPGAHYKKSEKMLNAYELLLLKDTFGNDIANALKLLFELFGSHLKKESMDMSQFDEIRYIIETQISNI